MSPSSQTTKTPAGTGAKKSAAPRAAAAKKTAATPAVKTTAKLPAVKTLAKPPAKAQAKPPAREAPAKARKNSHEAMLARVEQVRMKQREEGNFDCFGRAEQGYCDQGECVYHTECLSISRLLHSL